VNKWHWAPSDFINLGPREKAVTIAFIEQRIADEKAANKKASSKKGRRR